MDIPTPSASSGASSSPKDSNPLSLDGLDLPNDHPMDLSGELSFLQSSFDSAQWPLSNWPQAEVAQPVNEADADWKWPHLALGLDDRHQPGHFNPQVQFPQNGTLDQNVATAGDIAYPDLLSTFPFSFTPQTQAACTDVSPASLSLAPSTTIQLLSPLSSKESTTTSDAGSPPRQREMNKNEPVQDDIGRRAREAAGVLHAVSTLPQPVSPGDFLGVTPQGQAGKLPVPRLAPRPISARSKQPTPPSSNGGTPSPPPEASKEQPTTTTGRPKTSHTTIERRYRTNLNARIQALKHAVPALRVLEKDYRSSKPDVIDERGFVDGVKVARKVSKANVLGKAVEYIRVLKKRELRLGREADGLKSLIAGLVGGQALLKEWEREWRERFGGEEMDEVEGDADEDGEDEEEDDSDDDDKPAKKRARKEPGALKRKPSFSASPPTEPPAKKRAHNAILATLPPSIALATAASKKTDSADKEKRKRGRPRKVQPVSMAADIDPSITLLPPHMHPHQMQYGNPHAQQQAQPATYLLATFVFFSFFRSPVAPMASHSHPAHYGSVLSTPTANPQPVAGVNDWNVVAPSAWSYDCHTLMSLVHSVVTGLLLLTLILPFVPRRWLPKFLERLAFLPLGASTTTVVVMSNTSSQMPSEHQIAEAVRNATRAPAVDEDSYDSGSETEFAEDLSASATSTLADSSPIPTPSVESDIDEAKVLRRAVGLGSQGGGVGAVVGEVMRSALGSVGITTWTEHKEDREKRKAWERLGEVEVLKGNATPFMPRLHTYLRLAALSEKPSITELVTRALLVQPLAPGTAQSLWSRALEAEKDKATNASASEKLVVELGLENAVRVINNRATDAASGSTLTPVRAIATNVIVEQARAAAGKLFIRTVLGERSVDQLEADPATETELTPKQEVAQKRVQEKLEDRRRKLAIQAGKEMDGRLGEIVRLWERLDKISSGAKKPDTLDPTNFPADPESEDDSFDCPKERRLVTEALGLLRTLHLFLAIFPSYSPTTSLELGQEELDGGSMISPPPSPTLQSHALLTALRRALGSTVFEGDVDIEDARDRVIDLLAAAQRGRRRGRVGQTL